ncbi:hypothetical protein CPAR01_10655 [Colletotrichum paranaense]|uniref:Uncharacterized protein n=1 Tax=Colletotrichum paranaense TaxID=1914294 RepID=A0ABQ9SEP2_9PEZI|nr:uncharacterized protein CPAR01_10655 [Colletotrichum paranaense]KAK1533947.1 hypothetical protein CPAR01_10655 [Colletotrichum paranaense]
MASSMMDPSRMNSSIMNPILIDPRIMNQVLTATSNSKHIYSFGHPDASKLVEKCAEAFANILRENDHPDLTPTVKRLQKEFLAWGHEIRVFDEEGHVSEGKEIFDNVLRFNSILSKNLQMDLDSLYAHLVEVQRMTERNPEFQFRNETWGKATSKDPILLLGQDRTRDTTPGIGPRSRLGMTLFTVIPLRFLQIQLRYADFTSEWEKGVVRRLSEAHLRSVLFEQHV